VSGLVQYDAARFALEQAESVPEIKDVRDRAEALRAYAKRAGLGLEAQNQCAVLKLRAERKAGELLADEVARGNPNLKTPAKSNNNTLSTLGIAPHDSSRWQKLARIDEADFETYLSNAISARVEITQAAALRLANPPADRTRLEADEHEQKPLPPTDVLALEEAIENGPASTANRILYVVEKSLESCTQQQRHLYRRAHGITDSGLEEGEVVAEVARELGISRQTAHEGLRTARLVVQEQLNRTYTELVMRLASGDSPLLTSTSLDAEAATVAREATGTSTLDKTTAGSLMVRYSERSEARVNLGPGSEAMERVEKRGSGSDTTTMRVRAHQQYTKRDNT
jgi:hypothetical protein